MINEIRFNKPRYDSKGRVCLDKKKRFKKKRFKMIKETVTIDDFIKLLNELIALDKPAIGSLIANRIPCNEALAKHPTVQVSAQHGGFYVGLLGIFNGLFGVDDKGYGPIALEFEDNPKGQANNLIRFKRIDRTS